MSAKRCLAAFAFSLVSLLAIGAGAITRMETLRWTDSGNAAGTVTGYRVYYGAAPGSYAATPLSLPIPSIVGGAFQAGVLIPVASDTSDVYIAVTAINASNVESLFSNVICRGGTDGGCGATPSPTPTPTPTPTTASGAVVGFALWNAQTDVVIDSNFQTGEKISPATQPCVAIEILTNSYLQASGPGSVRTVFDGQGTSCSTVGVTHENSSPYAWQQDEGPKKFACASTLTVPGTHTLTVTPYDGDDCTGLAGTARTVQFEVVAPTTGTTQLGAPGQPFVIP